MRIVWMTDIHLNFLTPTDVQRFADRVAKEQADCIFVTGDIGESKSWKSYVDTLQRTAQVPVYFVLGNHDYYKGSIAEVRLQAAAVTYSSDMLKWLPACEPIVLSSGTVVVGVDGWGDARAGDVYNSKVGLNDWTLIREFSDEWMHVNHNRRVDYLRTLGAQEAAVLSARLEEIGPNVTRVFVLTHVPPLEGSNWYNGKSGDAEFAPWFVCASVGDVLTKYSVSHPDTSLVVLCGHTHGSGVYKPLDNLIVITQAAQYRKPAYKVIVL